MSQPSDPCNNALQYNSDIAGIGVRISFYIQVCLLVPAAKRSHADAVNAIWTLCATSLGLNISALIQVSNGNLSLLEGILVIQLALFAVFGMYMALAAYSRSKGKDTLAKVAAVAQTYFSLTLAVVLWVEAPRIPLSHCLQSSEIKFVILFGLALPAQKSGRIVSLAFSSLILMVYTCVTLYEFWEWVRRRRSKKNIDGHVKAEKNGSRPFRIKQSCVPDITPDFLGLLLLHIFVCIYFITTTELIIKRSNGVLSDPNWSFGQVLAMIAIMPAVVATIQGLVYYREERSSRNDISYELSDASASRHTASRPGSPQSGRDKSTLVDPNRLAPPLQSTSRAPSIRERTPQAPV
ncbi:hypothetical protein BU17DRAFT_96149 [Hysterangium stoloniferum]|nr:hypothetical protein BU17DRAFT_96149 [Hysterangium stoloniferum]